MREAINIIFQGNPDNPDMVFVEIENDNGESIRLGEWDNIPESNQHKLRITPSPDLVSKAEILKAVERLAEGNCVTLRVAEFIDFDSTHEVIRRLGFLDVKGDFHYTQAREIDGSWSGGMSRNIPARHIEKVTSLTEAIKEVRE